MASALRLLDLLENSLVLRQLAPYLPITSIYAVAYTSREYFTALRDAPETYRYLDLSSLKIDCSSDAPIDCGGINWRSQRMDEALTEDDFYCGPLRGVFSSLARQNALQYVQTMVLDGLTVPADLVQEILTEDRFNVRILSIREVKHLNYTKLGQVLKYIVRPSRPAGMPKLRGLYVFGPMETSQAIRLSNSGASDDRNSTQTSGVMSSEGAQIGAQLGATLNQNLKHALSFSDGHEDGWYKPGGRNLNKRWVEEWGPILQSCEGIIAFDAVLCRSPRHDLESLTKSSSGYEFSEKDWLPPAVASHAIGPLGCVKCGTCPESPARWSETQDDFLPLLSAVPRHTISIRAAQKPFPLSDVNYPRFIARCNQCCLDRRCERCFKWWCESCYSLKDVHNSRERSSEVRHDTLESGTLPLPAQNNIKVLMGLCTEVCLVSEMMAGAGSYGMWG